MGVSRKLFTYRLDLVGVPEVGWEGSGTVPAGEYTFLYRKGYENDELGTVCFIHKRIMSAVKRVEFVSGRMSCIILRGPWFHVNFRNIHAPTADKIDDMNYTFSEKLERIFDKFPK
jgi:hypothetical protein